MSLCFLRFYSVCWCLFNELKFYFRQVLDQTLFLVADESLQSHGRLHFDRHLFVIEQVLSDQLHCIPQHQVVVETQRAEAVQHPARLPRAAEMNTTYVSCQRLHREGLTYPGSQVTHGRVEEREHVVLQHQFHLLPVHLLLWMHTGFNDSPIITRDGTKRQRIP